MKDQAMTRSTFNNSGFQALALLDLTFTQHQLKVELYNMQTNLQAATETPTQTPCKKEDPFLVNVSVWRWLPNCPVIYGFKVNVSFICSLQRIDPLNLPVE